MSEQDQTTRRGETVKAIVTIAAAAIAGVSLIGIPIWVFTSRLHDCEAMGHGWFYCAFVWGLR